MDSRWKLSLAACALITACGISPSTTPTLNITSPQDGSSVNVPASSMVAVNFTTNFTLKSPGQCAGASGCGHVHLLVDSSTCNQQGQSYNALAVSSPVNADLGRCPKVAGMHTIAIELHHDDGTIYNDLIGNPETTKVTITAQVP
jgi:hypothetical protein